MATSRQKAVRIIVSAAVILGAFSALFFEMAQKDAEFYKHVDEVMSDPGAWYGKPLQLHGFVDGQIQIRPNTLDYKFNVRNGAAVVTAMYTGIVPDTLKDGSEVVVKGRLERDGFHVEPEGVMAKCPSRYTPANAPATTQVRGGDH